MEGEQNHGCVSFKNMYCGDQHIVFTSEVSKQIIVVLALLKMTEVGGKIGTNSAVMVILEISVSQNVFCLKTQVLECHLNLEFKSLGEG